MLAVAFSTAARPGCDGSAGHKRQSDAVVAVALARRSGAVVEDVALMAAAAPAVVLTARHDQLEVHLGDDGIAEGLIEAGPAGAAVELGLGAEQGQPAAGADEGALAMLLIERAGKRALRTFSPQHGERGRAQPFFPFGFAQVPGGIERLGGCIGLLGPEQGNQCCHGSDQALQQLSHHRSARLERHRGFSSPSRRSAPRPIR